MDALPIEKIKETYERLRMCQGAWGKERIKLINYYFSQLSELFLSDMQKYLLQTAQEQSDLFDPDYIETGVLNPQLESWRRSMFVEMSVSSPVVSVAPELRKETMKKKEEFDALLMKFYLAKCELMECSKRLESTFDQFNSKLTIKQIGLSIIYLEKYRF